MTDSITLHQTSDGAYHWCCPNCAKENGLDHKTDLAAYLPEVQCQNCGFEFGVANLFSEVEMAKSPTLEGEQEKSK